MKYTAAVLLLALACAGARAQEYFAFYRSSGGDPAVVSPLLIQHASVIHMEYEHPGRGMMITGLAAAAAGIGVIMWGSNEVDRGKEMVVEYRRTHRQGVARDGDGGGGYTKQFWGNVMRLGGGSLTSFGVYLVVKGALKNHRFHKQYRDDYSPPGVQPAAPMSLGTARALRKKISGIAMVGTGSALQVAGLILLNNGNKYSTDRIIGQAALLAGTGLAVPGTFLWIKGAREQRVYRDYPSIHSSLSLYLAPMPTLCYRF